MRSETALYIDIFKRLIPFPDCQDISHFQTKERRPHDLNSIILRKVNWTESKPFQKMCADLRLAHKTHSCPHNKQLRETSIKLLSVQSLSHIASHVTVEMFPDEIVVQTLHDMSESVVHFRSCPRDSHAAVLLFDDSENIFDWIQFGGICREKNVSNSIFNHETSRLP